MKQVAFGKTGAKVSEMCLGTMMFGKRTEEAEADRIVSYAFEHGVSFLDTAAMYGDGACEEMVGRLLAGRRSKFFLATKVDGVAYADITGSIDKSLRRLQTDCVDLFMIHWPQVGMDPLEVMRALNDVVRAGKTRFVGCCNYPAWLLEHHNAIARANGWPRLACNQIPYNPVERGAEIEVLTQAHATGVAITVYRPLLEGILAGKYDPDKPMPADSRATWDDRVKKWMTKYDAGVRFLLNFAHERGVTPSAVAVAWLRACPAVTCPIIGASRFSQIEEGVKAFEFSLTAAEREAISNAFDADLREDAGGKFPEFRRKLDLVAR